jgi:hypothetical protein
MLEQESGIDPGVVAERGYATVTRRSDLPEFSKKQRRAGPDTPALRVPMYSPDGITRLSQIRPHTPRVKGLKYETPAKAELIIDVHPRMRDRVRHGDEPLLITEGCKTGDAATSLDIPTLVLAGVWGWCVPKVKPYKLRPCWGHVNLEGREIIIAFDSDCMTKENVQRALEALVRCLEDRGAVVKVIYLPDAQDGSKQGIDDYLVAGGTIKEMFMLARAFEPSDIGEIRMSRDDKLRAAVEDLELTFLTPGRWSGMGGHGNREVFLALITEAAKSGKLHPDGVRVRLAQRKLAERAACGSTRTVWKSLNRLEESGLIYRDNKGREADASGGFVLRPRVRHIEKTRTEAEAELDAEKEEAARKLQGAYPPGDLPLSAPRLRWSSPKWKPTEEMIHEHRLGTRSYLPEPRERVDRLGKICGHVVDFLELSGGSASEKEIAYALGVKRLRNLRRRTLLKLEGAGVITYDGDQVILADGWLVALEREREAKGEIERAELDRQRFEREGLTFSEDIRSFKKRCRDQRRAFGWPEFWRFRQNDCLTPHWANNPDADGVVEDLEPASPGGDLSPQDTEVLAAIEAFEGKYGRGSFEWSWAGAKKLFYSAPGDHWPESEQLKRIRHHVEGNRNAEFVSAKGEV